MPFVFLLIACDAVGGARSPVPAQQEAAIADGDLSPPSDPDGLVRTEPVGAEDDPRVRGIPQVGENGASEHDVAAMRSAAEMLLAAGECSEIAYAGTSPVGRDIHYVNCGGYQNRYFRTDQDRTVYCGTSASGCSSDGM